MEKVKGKCQIKVALNNLSPQPVRRNLSQRIASGQQLPGALRPREVQGGSISSTASSSGCSSEESTATILEDSTRIARGKFGRIQVKAQTGTSSSQVSDDDDRQQNHHDELKGKDDDDDDQSFEMNDSLYVGGAQSRANGPGRAAKRTLNCQPAALHRAATFIEDETQQNRQPARQVIVGAPMSEFSAFTLRKSFKSGLLQLNQVNLNARKAGLELNFSGATTCKASATCLPAAGGPPELAAGSARTMRLRRTREEVASCRKTTPVRRSATIKLSSSGSVAAAAAEDNKLLRSEHFYCCCCAGHCKSSPKTTSAAGNSSLVSRRRRLNKASATSEGCDKPLSGRQQSAPPSSSPGQVLLEERRCGVQLHRRAIGVSTRRRPLPVAPPVVPLHKEMALFGDRNKHQVTSGQTHLDADQPKQQQHRQQKHQLSSMTPFQGCTPPGGGSSRGDSSTNRLTNLGCDSNGGSHNFENTPGEHLESNEVELEEVETRRLYSDNWHQQLTRLRPQSGRLATSSPHLSQSEDDGGGCGSSVASGGEIEQEEVEKEEERGHVSLNFGATIGRKTAGRIIGKLKQSLLFNFVMASAAPASANNKKDLEGKTGKLEATSSSLGKTNNGAAAAANCSPLADDSEQPIYDTPECGETVCERPAPLKRRTVVRPAEPPPPPPPPPAAAAGGPNGAGARTGWPQGDCAQVAQSQWRARLNEALGARQGNIATNDPNKQLAGSITERCLTRSCEIIPGNVEQVNKNVAEQQGNDDDHDDDSTKKSILNNETSSEQTGQVLFAVTSDAANRSSDSLDVGRHKNKRIIEKTAHEKQVKTICVSEGKELTRDYSVYANGSRQVHHHNGGQFGNDKRLISCGQEEEEICKGNNRQSFIESKSIKARTTNTGSTSAAGFARQVQDFKTTNCEQQSSRVKLEKGSRHSQPHCKEVLGRAKPGSRLDQGSDESSTSGDHIHSSLVSSGGSSVRGNDKCRISSEGKCEPDRANRLNPFAMNRIESL